jgi:hypothetical protein
VVAIPDSLQVAAWELPHSQHFALSQRIADN